LLDGAGLVTALALATSVEATFWMVFLSQRVGIDLLDQLEARHLELAVAHTDLRRMQEVVLQQHKLAGLGLMAAGVAHEINNPMAYVTSNVSMLLKDLRAAHGLPPALQEYAAEVLPETLDGIRRVNAIVADLGRFARGDAESGNASYGLNEQVEHALRIAQKELTQRCRVVRDLGESPALFGRPQQITQVLVNLLVNAAQSIAQEGTVTVVTRQNGDEAIVSVSDSGSGMTAETRSHLFEPFFTTKPVGKGTGLGLAVIHGIVRAHGGHIEVESELGKGSRFTVHLPLKAPTTQGEAWASDLQLIALRGAATEEKRPGPRG
jgi:signal transduction histidine kinase